MVINYVSVQHSSEKVAIGFAIHSLATREKRIHFNGQTKQNFSHSLIQIDKNSTYLNELPMSLEEELRPVEGSFNKMPENDW